MTLRPGAVPPPAGRTASSTRSRRSRGGARARGTTPAALALAWLLATRDVTAVVVGPRRPEHLDAAPRGARARRSHRAERDELTEACSREPPRPRRARRSRAVADGASASRRWRRCSARWRAASCTSRSGRSRVRRARTSLMGLMPAYRGGERRWSLKEIVVAPENPAARPRRAPGRRAPPRRRDRRAAGAAERLARSRRSAPPRSRRSRRGRSPGRTRRRRDPRRRRAGALARRGDARRPAGRGAPHAGARARRAARARTSLRAAPTSSARARLRVSRSSGATGSHPERTSTRSASTSRRARARRRRPWPHATLFVDRRESALNEAGDSARSPRAFGAERHRGGARRGADRRRTRAARSPTS